MPHYIGLIQEKKDHCVMATFDSNVLREYKLRVHGLDKETWKPYIGKIVEVIGRVDQEDTLVSIGLMREINHRDEEN